MLTPFPYYCSCVDCLEETTASHGQLTSQVRTGCTLFASSGGTITELDVEFQVLGINIKLQFILVRILSKEFGEAAGALRKELFVDLDDPSASLEGNKSPGKSRVSSCTVDKSVLIFVREAVGRLELEAYEHHKLGSSSRGTAAATPPSDSNSDSYWDETCFRNALASFQAHCEPSEKKACRFMMRKCLQAIDFCIGARG